MFAWEESRGPIWWGFTRADAPGGASRAPYGTFNLGDHVGDEVAAVKANRAALCRRVGARHLVAMEQVHGASVAVVDDPGGVPPRADAIVTSLADVALMVLVADCTPVLLDGGEVVGAVHAGRPGMAAGVVPAAVAVMRDLGARDIVAAVGPSICGRCYEVPEALRAEVAAVAPVSSTVSWNGTPALDVAAGVVDQLRDLEVVVTWVPGCSRESAHLFSYRRDGRTGRFAGVIVRRGSRADH